MIFSLRKLFFAMFFAALAIKAFLSVTADIRGKHSLAARYHVCFAECGSSQTLVLNYGRISDPRDFYLRLREIPTICGIEYHDVPVTSQELRWISHSPRLRFVSLRNASISDEQLKELDCSHIKALCLASNDVTGSTIPFRTLSSLKRLNLNHTKFSDIGAARIAIAEQLRVLLVSDTKISNLGVRALAELPSLEILDISNNRITDEAINSQFRTLRILHAQSTDITLEPFISNFYNFQRLESINITPYCDLALFGRYLEELEAVSYARYNEPLKPQDKFWYNFSE